MASILVRTVIIYMVLIGMLRFTGKRQIGQLQVSELITAFLLSEIASHPITNANVPLLYAIVPIVIILCLEVILSFLATKWAIAKKILDGRPSIIIRGGVPDQKEMAKIRMSVEDLLCQLRLKDAASPAVVDCAVFEQNGQLSLFQKTDAPQINGFAHPLVVDGHIVRYGLEETGRDLKWVKNELKKQKINDFADVFLMTCDDGGAVTVYRREKK